MGGSCASGRVGGGGSCPVSCACLRALRIDSDRADPGSGAPDNTSTDDADPDQWLRFADYVWSAVSRSD